MYSKKIRRKEFHIASSFKQLINLFNIFSSSRMFSFRSLVVTPAYSARLGGGFLISSGFSTLRYNSGVRKFLNKLIMYIKQIEFCCVSSSTLLSSSSHPEHRTRTIFVCKYVGINFRLWWRMGEKSQSFNKVVNSHLIHSNTITVLCSVLEEFFPQEGSHIFGRCGFLPSPRLKNKCCL